MYYIMRCPIPQTEEGEAYMEIHNTFDVGDIYMWEDGLPLEQEERESIPSSIEIDFDVFRGYTGPPKEFEDLGVSIMSQRLHDALISAGVDNIEFFPAVLTNTSTGEKFKYYAYKLVGIVSLMDEGQSEYETYRNTTPIADTTIHKFVADESKAHGLLMFRMAESITAIVVHESVKKTIEAAGIDTLKFIKPEDYVSI